MPAWHWQFNVDSTLHKDGIDAKHNVPPPSLLHQLIKLCWQVPKYSNVKLIQQIRKEMGSLIDMGVLELVGMLPNCPAERLRCKLVLQAG